MSTAVRPLAAEPMHNARLAALARKLRWPVLVFALALLPRLIDLGTRPFWLDEATTFQRASLALSALVNDSFTNRHMPTYFLMLSPLVGLHHPEFWLRLPSAIFGALAVMLVFMIGARIAGRTAGLIAALIIGLSPLALAYSQEARSYMLEMCMVLIALYGVTCLAADIPAASKPIYRGPAFGSWLAFIGGSVLALAVLADALPWVITANLIGAGLAAFSPNRRQLLRNFLTADLIIALCCGPFYGFLETHAGQSYQQTVMWIPPLSLSRLWYDFGSVYFMHIADWVTYRFMDAPVLHPLVWCIDAGLALAVGAAFWVLRRRPAVLVALGVSFVFLPLAITIVSIWLPILVPRYILWSAAPFAILAGIGASALLDYLSPRWRVAAMSAAAILLLTNMAPYYQAETKPRWDIAAKMLAQDVKPGDVVYLYDSGALPVLRHYLPPSTQTVVLNDSQGDLDHAKLEMSQGKRVWAVFGHAGQNDDTLAMKNFYQGVEALGRPEVTQIAGRRIIITLYDPANHGVAMTCTQMPLPPHLLAACS